MTDELFADTNNIRIAYETFGAEGATPLLLVMGFATQMIAWPDELCQLLAGRGYHVIRFDNRDVGRSTHLHDAAAVDLLAVLSGDSSTAAYRLEDMADDTAGLLDALSIDSAHVVGASMGGMIAQTLAIRHPTRVRSLTSIMSSTDPAIGAPTADAAAVALQEAARTRNEAIDRALSIYRVIRSPGFPFDEQRIRDVAGRAFDRGYDAAGVARQLAAIHASGDRTQALRSVDVPTLVIHGEEDKLVQIAGGEATAAAISGAELVRVPGMGHDLPRPLWPRFAELIESVARRAESTRSDPPPTARL